MTDNPSAIVVPKPRYHVGDKVWVAGTNSQHGITACTFCENGKVVGREGRTAPCPQCHGLMVELVWVDLPQAQLKPTCVDHVVLMFDADLPRIGYILDNREGWEVKEEVIFTTEKEAAYASKRIADERNLERGVSFAVNVKGKEAEILSLLHHRLP